MDASLDQQKVTHAPHLMPRDTGWVEVITGSMFSGKTEELLRRVRRARIAKQNVLLVKPSIDRRYSEDHVVSHDQAKQASLVIREPREILAHSASYMVIAIDEAQFFDSSLSEIVKFLAHSGKRVIVAGLDQDFKGQAFGSIPELICQAEYVTKLLAICTECGNPATCNQRLVAGDDLVLLGAAESYEARCRRCFVPGGVLREQTARLSL